MPSTLDNIRIGLASLGQAFIPEARGIDAPLSFSDVYGKGLDLFGYGSNTKTGLVVTRDTALQVSTVYGCFRIISDGVATLPMDQMRRVDGVPGPSRPRAAWLDFQLGPWNKIEIVGQIITSLLSDGNAYIATVRDEDGMIMWLDIVDPEKVKPERLSTGEIVYKVNLDNGRTRTVSSMDIHHIRGLMLPGSLEGCSPITYAKETVGLARASTEFGGAFFGNGAIPGSTIEVPGELSLTAAKVIKDTWEQAHRGVGNSGRIAVLTEGARYSKVTLSPEEAQFLQTRSFEVADIARFFGVPLSLLNAEGVVFGDTTAENNTAYVQHTLRPWIERVEAAFTSLLMSEGRPAGNFVQINADGLMRGNLNDRMAAYNSAVTQGIFTINEIRRWEGMPPVEWGNGPISVQVQQGAGGVEDEPAMDEEQLPEEDPDA